MELLGRDEERRALHDLIARARASQGAALVVRADAGLGKTVLLDDAVRTADGFAVARIEGVESEMDLPYAGLHRLLLPFLDGLGQLPGRQRDALRAALGLGHTTPRDDRFDRFAVGLATLSLLDRASVRVPVACVVDDAHWIDRESVLALALAARRLGAERLVILLAGRPAPDVDAALEGLPVLELRGLDERDAISLVERVVDGRLDPAVTQRIVRETAGTPLAIVELARELGAGELAVRGLAPEPLPIGRRLEDHFLQQVRQLPAATRQYLVLAAAEPTQDPVVVGAAAVMLGLAASCPEPAVDAGLFARGGPPAFRHPLIRSAVYGGASMTHRRRAHAALADVAVAPAEADRRAWHLAAAVDGPRDDVADALHAAADRASSRGGHSTAGMFLARAAELTSNLDRRLDRELGAAARHLTSGAVVRARALLDTADTQVRDRPHRARALRLRGEIEFAADNMANAVALLVESARAVAPTDIALARTTLLHAAAATRFAGRFAPPGCRDIDIAAAARDLPLPAGTAATAPHLLLDAYSDLHLAGNAVAMPVLRQALAALAAADTPTDESLLWLGVGAWVASTVADDTALHALSGRAVDAARERGAINHLAHALLYRAMSHLLGGSLRAAHADFSERAELLGALGVSVDVGSMVVSAWAGREVDARTAMARVQDYAVEHELGWMLVFSDYARAVLEIGLGNYEAALAGTSTEYLDDSFLVIVGFPNVIEALARCGRLTEAQGALAAFAERAKSIGGAISLGLVARSSALLADDQFAEDHFREALDLLEGSRAELQIARAHLLYGEWLRRQKRRRDARVELRTALDYFTTRGVEGFARRARAELEATGERLRPLPTSTGSSLTPQETQIARLAAEGLTNHEIAAKLFLSPSTVDYHLRKIFRKLGIQSRRRLRDVTI